MVPEHIIKDAADKIPKNAGRIAAAADHYTMHDSTNDHRVTYAKHGGSEATLNHEFMRSYRAKHGW